ncbi:MAG: V-type ATP synthase subunit I [Bacteroidaceae bacterium]|nr:V-type ATP synthase subunit I [Bacteroidaceae bacterium]
MITKMKKLDFLVYYREYEAFLEKLRSLGVVHVSTLRQGSPAPDSGLGADLKKLSRMQSVLASVSNACKSVGLQTAVSVSNADEVLDNYDALMNSKTQLEQNLQALSRERSQLQPWGDFEPSNVARLAESGYCIRFYSCPLKSFNEEWTERYNAIKVEGDRQKTYFITITGADVRPDIDAEECRLPQTSLSAIQVREQELKARLDAIPAQLAGLGQSGIPLLEDAIARTENRIGMERVRLSGEKTCDDSLVLLEGWVPAAQVSVVTEAIESAGVYCDVQDPEAGDDIPIQLDNNRFAKLFEPLTKLYMLPSYQELDLTLMFAPFFMLFFGLCLGDMGYGLLMIVALPVFTKLFQLINPNFSKWLVVLFGASTMLCGTLSGTFFGFNIYDLNIPFIQSMKELLYTDNSTMFTVSLCIGVVQILFGMILKAVNLTIQCGFKAAISTVGWILLLVTVAVCALAGIDFGSPVVLAVLGIAAVGIFLLNTPGKNPLLNIGVGLWDTYNMATGLLGDVLSYVRLFALGLSGGILANVFNSMAVGMKPDNPVAGFIVMVLIFVIGHALNIFMNILGAIVHPMRLTFVEFFKNAGYTGGGVEYSPFKIRNNN